MILILLASFWIYKKDGYSNRQLPKSLAASNFAQQFYVNEYKSKYQNEVLDGSILFATPNNCEFNLFKNNEADSNVYIFGDSHAMHLYPGLARASEKENMSYARSADQMLTELNGERKNSPCLDIENLSLFFNLVKHDNKHKVVILSFSNNGGYFSNRETSIILNNFIEALSEANITVLFIGDIPRMKVPALQALNRPFSITNPTEKLIQDFSEIKHYLHPPQWLSKHAKYIITLDHYCPQQACQIFNNYGELLYRNEGHLNYDTGSNFIAEYLVPKINYYLNNN